jgi:PAS domain S-box-containing protein
MHDSNLPVVAPAEQKIRSSMQQANAMSVASEARYRAFFDHAEDSLCDVAVTPGGGFICLDINPHAEVVIGVAASAIRGRTPEQVLGPDAGGRIIAALTRCIQQDGLRYEETWETVRGPRLTDTIMVPLRDERNPSGPYVRVLCSIRDITDRRQLETQVAQGQRLQALGQLAGGIAHDFNNVLQAIEASASLMLRRASDQAAVERIARTMLDATARASSITRRLLTFTRCDELRAEAFDPTAMVVVLREILASTLGANISVCIDLPEDLPSVQADKALVETTLVNLATNARDAMPQGGTLTLSAQAEVFDEASPRPSPISPGAASVRFEVTDTGEGMDAATLARAAEPFFTTKPRGQGTGLGLSMARRFAEQSGGALAISSVQGLGTKVSVWFPQAAVATTSVKSDDTGQADAEAPRNAPRVLVVDDDALVCETVRETLEMAGYSAFSAADADAALSFIARNDTIDLLLTDFSMPGLNGVGLIREVQRRQPGLPAILMTGYAGDVEGLSDENAAHARFVLLRKPIASREMLAQLASLLADAAAQGQAPYELVVAR